MRTLAETKTRWESTLKHGSEPADLVRAVKFNGPDSPCLAGCRSVCWKVFLLFRNAAPPDWPAVLAEARSSYGALRDRYLRYIKHPDQLSGLAVDPLADVPHSPWDALRRDELVRAEILQDVRRLPDKPFYHREDVQTLILDVLFVYCKLLDPAAGGYRQGMHELLAPLVFAVAQDAVERADTNADALDPAALEVLDASYVEHDSFALFLALMDRAKSFYDLGPPGSDHNVIVGKSQHIHEAVLAKADPELASHLKNIEVLPQIFLIRWIRLLFGREFPFEKLFVLWDTIFAFDPSLGLVDLICVAMLIRVRWTLLEADYASALQLLLRYPSPEAPHGPHTFVDDALYLRDHLDVAGGSALILKYSGRSPATQQPQQTRSRPSTPVFPGFPLRPRALGARSPLSAHAKFLQNPGAVEALFQGAAKGVMERGEKLGINQAVRDAMGEIRRNMQGLHDARASPKSFRVAGNDGDGSYDNDDGHPSSVAAAAVAGAARRDRRLAAMLDDAVAGLKMATASSRSRTDGSGGDADGGDSGSGADKSVEMIELATAKIELVKLHLQDPTLILPDEELMPPIDSLSISSPPAPDRITRSITPFPGGQYDGPSSPPLAKATIDSPSIVPPAPPQAADNKIRQPAPLAGDSDDRMDTDAYVEALFSNPDHSEPTAQQQKPPSNGGGAVDVAETRGDNNTASTIRTDCSGVQARSTLAQSSFSWMLEPEDTPATAAAAPARCLSPPSATALSSSRNGNNNSVVGNKRPQNSRTNSSRERNAFLFGEVTSEAGDSGRLGADEIFGLMPLRKGSARGKGRGLESLGS